MNLGGAIVLLGVLGVFLAFWVPAPSPVRLSKRPALFWALLGLLSGTLLAIVIILSGDLRGEFVYISF